MSWLESFRTSWSAVYSHALRSTLTVLGILIGIAAVILTVGIGLGTQKDVSAQISALGSNLLIVAPGSSTDTAGLRGGFGSSSTLTIADAEALMSSVNAPDISGVAAEKTTSLSLEANDTNWTTSVTDRLVARRACPYPQHRRVHQRRRREDVGRCRRARRQRSAASAGSDRQLDCRLAGCRRAVHRCRHRDRRQLRSLPGHPGRTPRPDRCPAHACASGFGGTGGGTPPTDMPAGADGTAPTGMPTALPTDLPADGAGFGSRANGLVTAVTATEITVDLTDTDGVVTSESMTVDGATSYTKTSASDSSAVAVGLCATAQGEADDSGSFAAAAVALSVTGDDGCVSAMAGPGGRMGGAANE
ncbi:ABC transporter permease [Cryobacterium sp. PH31-L1]|uniref:ABC transporter permease n=1 Tax=Cryobacterium sp. PH31-L1 TaxID=3046199 RepID=UPI0024B995A6|nr:ABC transporter permease [Cryobacterium sp. PH31-L1]MDJ0377619.1 ABC transporter permease [Cryobacterium sp. PH31-L1]